MNLTKLRGLTKISSKAVQNCRKPFSYKYDLTPAGAKEAEDSLAAPATEPEAENVRYTVCQNRTSPLNKPQGVADIMAATAKANIEHQHLQPAMLPEFYQKQMDRNVLVNPQPDPSEEDHIAPAHNRRFQVSKTYANAILPLKMVKLANPFPEPVKMMSSRTVSDLEKSDQMLMEARSQRQFNEQQQALSQFGHQQQRNFSTIVKRWYAKTVGNNPEKCKKFAGGSKQCPKMKLGNCPPPARTRCERIAKDINCKKQEAPYPAYSEFCHEDIDERPSECKLCPWKPEENPNFKPKKKDYHTSASAGQRRGLEYTAPRQIDDELEEEEILEKQGMLCDLRKKPCKRPNIRRCPPKKGEKNKASKKDKKKSKKPKKKALSADDILDAEVLEQNAMLMRHDDHCNKVDKCKIKKFPFPKCPETSTKRTPSGMVCPKKKKKPLVKDCPPSGCQNQTASEEIVEEMQLSGKRKGKNCPVVDHTKVPLVTPCKPKQKDNTRVCPGDLLKRKRRKPGKPKKKASEESDIVPPQPTQKVPLQPTRTL